MRMLAAHPSNGMGCRRASGNGREIVREAMRQGGLTRRQMLKASAGALPLVVVARHAAAQAENGSTCELPTQRMALAEQFCS